MGDNFNGFMDEETRELIKKFSQSSLRKDSIDNISEENENEEEFDECFGEYIKGTLKEGIRNQRRAPVNPCDSCRRKQVIIKQFNRVCNKEYIPPYVDLDCRNYKIASIIERVDECIVEKVFQYLIFRVSVREIINNIDDPEWRRQAEDIIRAEGYGLFIQKNFGNFNKKQIIAMLFDVNYCYFDYENKRNLDKTECVSMLKYYIVVTLRDKINDSFLKIVKLIELELEYEIAVVEGEIRYLIKCILQEIVITPFQVNAVAINYFNVIGALTELLKIFDGFEGGKHDERSDFRHIRDTIRKYEKVVRTAFDMLNKKLKQWEKLIDQRSYIVGATGICEFGEIIPLSENDNIPVVTPPIPLIVVDQPKD